MRRKAWGWSLWVALVAVIAAAAFCTSSFALSYAPQPWEKTVYEAGFVGVVECVKPGLAVGEYVVVASWKGAEVGAKLRVWHSSPVLGEQRLVALNAWEPRQYPDLTVGAYGGMDHTAPFWPEPLADWEPSVYLNEKWPVAPSFFKHVIGDENVSAEQFRETVVEFVRDENRDVRLVAAMLRMQSPTAYSTMADGSPSPMADQMLTCEHPVEAIQILYDGTIASPELLQDVTARVVSALPEALFEIAHELARARPELPAAIHRRIESRVEQRRYQDVLYMGDSRWMTEDRARRVFAEWAEAKAQVNMAHWVMAVQWLSHKDSEPVVTFLKRLDDGAEVLGHQFVPYNMAVYVSEACPATKSGLLAELATARHGAIAVAGANFLAFHEPEAGKRLLERLVQRDDVASAWAALALACHGYHEYVDEAFDLFLAHAPADEGWAFRFVDTPYPD